MEVLPVNIYLKSPNDRQTIISGFAAYLQVSPGCVRLLVEPLDDGGNGVALGLHAGLVLEDQEKPVPDGIACHALTDLPDIIRIFE